MSHHGSLDDQTTNISRRNSWSLFRTEGKLKQENQSLQDQLQTVLKALDKEKRNHLKTWNAAKALDQELAFCRRNVHDVEQKNRQLFVELDAVKKQLKDAVKISKVKDGPEIERIGAVQKDIFSNLTRLNTSILHAAGVLGGMLTYKRPDHPTPLDSDDKIKDTFSRAKGMFGDYMTLVLASKLHTSPSVEQGNAAMVARLLMQDVLINWCIFKLTGSWELVNVSPSAIEEMWASLKIDASGKKYEITSFVASLPKSDHHSDKLMFGVTNVMNLLELLGWFPKDSNHEEELMLSLSPILKATQGLKNAFNHDNTFVIFNLAMAAQGVGFVPGKMEEMALGDENGKSKSPQHVAFTAAFGLKWVVLKRVNDEPHLVTEILALPKVIISSSIGHLLGSGTEMDVKK